MDISQIGLPTYHTRVERWECDYNDHWNVQFYGRSFQMAAERIAAQDGRANPGAAAISHRHMRFHRELRVSAPVEIRSAVLREAVELDGRVVHLLISASQIAATALDVAGAADHLPRVSADMATSALPRGITGTPASGAPPKGALVTKVELGPIRREHLDHTGRLRFETLLWHASNIQHQLLNDLGLTPDYAESHRINRMGVEFRVTPGANPPEGALLRGRTWVTAIKGKALWANNQILDLQGDVVGTVEMCVVTVNLDSRKAVAVPDFMYRALGE